MDQYIEDGFPSLHFTTIEAAKDFAEKIGYDEYKIVELLYFPIDSDNLHKVGYGILVNDILLR